MIPSGKRGPAPANYGGDVLLISLGVMFGSAFFSDPYIAALGVGQFIAVLFYLDKAK